MIAFVAENVNATYNWFGTTDIESIRLTMNDFNRDFALGNVTFIPFLSEFNSQAPTIQTLTLEGSAGTGGTISPMEK